MQGDCPNLLKDDIFPALVKMILIRLMVSFTEVGFRYKLFFNIEPGATVAVSSSEPDLGKC